jgi:hypothetical protein
VLVVHSASDCWTRKLSWQSAFKTTDLLALFGSVESESGIECALLLRNNGRVDGHLIEQSGLPSLDLLPLSPLKRKRFLLGTSSQFKLSETLRLN